MKRIVFIIALASACGTICAQTSKVGKLSIGKGSGKDRSTTINNSGSSSFKPPILEIVGDPVFEDADGNNAINAGEQCRIVLTVKNSGLGPATGLKSAVKLSGTTQGVSARNGERLPDIPVGGTSSVVFPITAGLNTADGSMNIEFAIDEPKGFGTEPRIMAIQTRSFKAPKVVMASYQVAGSGANVLKKASIFEFQAVVQNLSYGRADDVSIDLRLPEDVYRIDGDAEHLGNFSLEPGESRLVCYKLIINNRYSGTEVPVSLVLKEKYGKYAENGLATLKLNQRFDAAPSVISINAREDNKQEIVLRTLRSDVDMNVPQVNVKNDDTFVLIIANSDYKQESYIPTAATDGRTMKEYCTYAMGIPEKNITIKENLTKVEMEDAVTFFSNNMKYYPESRFLVFYYGHGMSENNGSSYLIPIDGSSERVANTCYSKDKLVKALTRYDTDACVLFLESCFSGRRPDDMALHYGEGSSSVRIRPSDSTPEGNIVIISASSGTQTASAYAAKNHNLFTYTILKAFMDKGSKGGMTLGELFDTAKLETARTALRELNREQEPTVTVGTGVTADWRKWKLN